MSDNKLQIITPTTIVVPNPYGGVRSSIDLNKFMDGVKSDIYTIIEALNDRVRPILNGLPLGEVESTLDAVIDGLTSEAMYIGPYITANSTYAEYYYHSAMPERSNTVKETLDLLIGKLVELEDELDTLTNEVDDLGSTTDFGALLAEVRDLRNSVAEIIAVLRSLIFYTDARRIQSIIVLSDPDLTKAPLQVLIGRAPGIKYSATVNQSLYLNFTIPTDLDTSQPIYPVLTYCMDTDEVGSSLKLDMEYLLCLENELVTDDTNVVTKTITITPPSTANAVGYYVPTGSEFYITDTINGTFSDHQLVNVKLTRDCAVASNHTGNFYVLDLSFYYKARQVSMISI
jgi:hypothetical protein